MTRPPTVLNIASANLIASDKQKSITIDATDSVSCSLAVVVPDGTLLGHDGSRQAEERGEYDAEDPHGGCPKDGGWFSEGPYQRMREYNGK